MATLTAPIGSVLIGLIIDKFGRRTALLISTIPTFFAWILLSWNYNFAISLIGQALNGVSCGSLVYPCQVYASECIMVNNIRWRDNYLSWLGVSSAFGMCFALLLAYFVDYQTIAVVSATIAFVTILLIYGFIPESPLWLYGKGRLGDAEWSQSKLRISQPILRAHTSSISEAQEQTEKSEPSEPVPAISHWKSAKLYIQLGKRKDVYKPLLIMIGVFVVLTFCGAINVMVYLVNVISENDLVANTTSIPVQETHLSESYKYSAIAGILILISNCMVCAIVGHIGVKKILTTATLFIAMGFMILGYTTTHQKDVENSFTLHILAVWLIIFAFSFGVMNLPNAVLGDIFPAEAKGFASIVCVIEFLMTAFLIKIHPYMKIAFGGYLYYGYASVSLIGSVYIAMAMVDTVGKTSEQIKLEFTK